DMLEDVAGHCFYAACGLTTADLGRIARCAPLTPARLAEGLGTAWVRRHLPRLVALGVVDFAPADERDARGAVAPAPQRPIPC
ncbi:hypothetical protein KDM41_12935, partial [bacterium]|nr:hypothetical protein [bacterium]